MRAAEKKETMLVVFIFISAILLCLWFSNRHTDIVRINPSQQTILTDNDLLISSPAGSLIVGKSTREEVKKVYPEGKDLGKSGVYHPNNQDLLLSFSRKENILIKMDIGNSDLSTSRGIKVNDSFDKVIEKYGPNYTRAYDKTKPQIFDAYYGSDKYILFKVDNNVVTKIIIGSPL